MQGSGGCRDPRITTELRIDTLTKLVQDLLQGSDPLDERVNNRLRHSASRFETETYATVTSKEEYLRILSERPVTSILPNGDYIPPISGSIIMLAAMTANGAGINNMGHNYSGRVNLPQNERPSGISGGSHQASGEFSPRQNSYWRHLLTEHGNDNNQQHPHPRLLQMRRHDHLRQQHRQNQSFSSSHLISAASSSESQPAYSVVTEQVITNQMVGLPPNLFMNHDFQHQQLVQKSSNDDNVPLNDSRKNQLSKNKGILESQVPAHQTGSKDQPIILSESEDSNDWHDIAHKVLQRCREECFPVVSKVREHFSRLSPQGNREGIKKMASASKEMMRFITMQRTDMVHIPKDAFYSKIEKIYKFARAKHPILFPKPDEDTAQYQQQGAADIKWDFDVYDFYGIDIQIDLGCHMLDRRPNRPRVEMNNQTEQHL